MILLDPGSMRVALPICRGRISPVLDVARRLLLVEIIAGRMVDSREQTLTGNLRAAMEELGVEVLICAGVSRELAAPLEAAGVEVVAGVCGPMDEVVEAYIGGELDDERFAMPGAERPPSVAATGGGADRNPKEEPE